MQQKEQTLRTIEETDYLQWQLDSKFLKVIKDRVVNAAHNRHLSYLRAFLSEKGLTDATEQFDPIDLTLYTSGRLQTDNDWLVDKLEQLEQQHVKDEEIWLERMRIELDKARHCDECQMLTNRIDLLARQVPEQQELEHYKSTL